MVLEKSPSVSVRPRGTLARPAPADLTSSRDHPLLVWTQPSPARSVVDGLGGIGRAMGAAILVVAALIGAAMVVSLLLGAIIVQGFGVDLSGGY